MVRRIDSAGSEYGPVMTNFAVGITGQKGVFLNVKSCSTHSNYCNLSGLI